MRPNRVKQRIREGKIAFGTYVNLADPAMVEILGLAGLDAVLFDMEHASFDLGLIEQMIRAADLVDVTPCVRVPDNDPKLMLRLLEIGAQGIMVPHVHSREEAAKAVKAVRYDPLGERGALAGSRAARYGTVPWEEHARTSNEEILLFAMVEDSEGLSNLASIAGVEGVDLILIGPHDLAESLGIAQPNDPRLWAAAEEIAQTLKQVGNARMALSHGHPVLTATIADLQRWGVGYSNLLPPPEAVVLRHYRERISELHAQMEQQGVAGRQIGAGKASRLD